MYWLLAELDATTGFHDIKPLPDFSAYDSTGLWWVGILLVLLGFVIYLFRRRPPSLPTTGVTISPYARALAELSELSSLQLTPRDFGSRLSLVLRGYLEDRFSFPAREQTVKEIETQLGYALRRELPTAPRQFSDEVAEEAVVVLRNCEKVTFADRSFGQADSLDSLVLRTRTLLEQVEGSVTKEEERRKSVVAETVNHGTLEKV